MINLKKMFLLLFIPMVVAGCSGNGSENKETGNDESKVEGAPESVVDFDVKEILSNYSVSPYQEEAVISIMNKVHYYLESNIDEILYVSLRKKKRAKNLDKVFVHGKVSAKSLEYYINDKIEDYNDNHLSDRLHNVTLEIVMDTMKVSPIYNELLVKQWAQLYILTYFDYPFEKLINNGRMGSEKRALIRDEMMNAYYALFKAENLIEQMIGVENNK